MFLLEMNGELFDTIWNIASVVYFLTLLIIVIAQFIFNNKIHAWKFLKLIALPILLLCDSVFAILLKAYISIPCIIILNILFRYVYIKVDIPNLYDSEIKGGYAIWEYQRKKQIEQARFSQLHEHAPKVTQKEMQIHPIWYGAVTTVSIILAVFINSLYY